MAFEVARRWSPSAVAFLRNLARAQSPSTFNPALVRPALDRSVGLLYPAGLRCQLVGEASGNVRLCERAGGARERFGPPSMHVRD